MVTVGHGDLSERRATQSALARSAPVKDPGAALGDSKSALGPPGADHRAHVFFAPEPASQAPSVKGAVRELPGCSKRHGPESGIGISSEGLILSSPARARAQIAGARVEGRRERDPTAARPRVKDARESVARLAALACALAIAGCAAGCAASAAPAPAPLMVQVPVLHQTPCPAPTLARPALPLTGLEAGSPPADTIRAYAAAVAILKGAVRERDAVLAGCARAKSATPAPVENVQ